MVDVEKFRESAAALIPQIIAERESKLAEFKQLHEVDKASFDFRCELHGGFLAVFMTRGPKPSDGLRYLRNLHGGYKTSNKTVSAINLCASRVLTLAFGSPPALDGIVTFTGNTDDGAVREVYQVEKCYRMIALDESAQELRSGMFLSTGYSDPLNGMHVKDCPRPAQDDSVYFVGSGIRLLAPAGRGQSMYDAILAALETGI